MSFFYLESKILDFYMTQSLSYKYCQLCPRNCLIDRTNSKLCYCGASEKMRISTIEAHFGEEPPISGSHGSGTVFFSGCSLKCIYCQNHQISHHNLGQYQSIDHVVDRIIHLIEQQQIHNLNFVTPDQFFPHTVEIVHALRQRRIRIPIVYNLSGYQRLSSLRIIEEAANIYLPDFKYSDPNLASLLSNAPDYPDVALTAISEMVCQKGFLNSFDDTNSDSVELATRGVLVRHLILPGQVKNSIDALTALYLEFGKRLPISLMSQYYPIKTFSISFLNRTVSRQEFDAVHQHALELGFENMFVQYPEFDLVTRPFLPDFSKEHPFTGNLIE